MPSDNWSIFSMNQINMQFKPKARLHQSCAKSITCLKFKRLPYVFIARLHA
jgi:hypothetical protein